MLHEVHTYHPKEEKIHFPNMEIPLLKVSKNILALRYDLIKGRLCKALWI
jgi:hypothetical protein